MSSSAFNELVSEIERSKKKLSRSASIDVDMQPSLLNPDRIDSSSRRALYGSLPFTAMFGMQSREQGMKRVLSHVASMESLGPEVGMTLHMTEDGTFVNREGQEAGQHSLQTEKDMDGTALTMPLIMAVIVAVASQFLVGLNTSIMNGGGDVIFQGHSVLLWSVAVASFAVGGPFGAILGGILANEKGRRGTILINAWVYFIGGAAMAIAPNIYWLIPARFMCGFASGLTTVVVPVYLGEIAPPTMRGALGTMSQFAQVIGIFASTMCAIPLLNDRLWRFHFTITPVIAAIQLFISPFLLESPRWLLGRSDRSTHARVVIKHLRGLRTDEEVEAEAQNYIYAHQRFKTQHQSAHSLAAYYDLIQNKSVRLLLSGAVLLQAAQQLCGINAVFYYSTSFFKGTLTDPHIGTAVVAFVNVLATYLALKLMDNTARRTLLLVSAGGMLVSAAVLLPALLGSLPPVTALLAVGGFVFFFEIGLGPIPWLIVAEMFDAKFVILAPLKHHLPFDCFPNTRPPEWFILHLNILGLSPRPCLLAASSTGRATS